MLSGALKVSLVIGLAIGTTKYLMLKSGSTVPRCPSLLVLQRRRATLSSNELNHYSISFLQGVAYLIAPANLLNTV